MWKIVVPTEVLVLGSGSSPVFKSPVISIFILDERHVATKQSKGQNISTLNTISIALIFLLSLSFPLCLSHLSLPSYCANKEEEEENYNKCGENLQNINKGNKAKPVERIYKTSRKEIKQSQ